MTITVNAKQAKEAIIQCFKAGLVPMLVSSPGQSKSSLIKEIAQENNKLVIDLRLSQCDPTDLMGYPIISNGKASYAPFNTFPIKGDKIPEGYTGTILLLDEFNSATIATQSSAYKLVLDRMVGQYELHESVRIICAGNLASDKAIVNRLSTAMQSRLIHLHLEVENEEWLEWAKNNKLDYRVISYIQFRPQALKAFDPKHNDYTFPCLRTWEFTSKLIKNIEPNLALICGTIGEAEGRQFFGYCQIFQEIPTIKDLISKPLTCTVPDEPSILYAITGLIGEYLSNTNAVSLMAYIERLPIEFQLITLRNAIKRDSNLKENKDIKSSWLKVSKQLV
jgi:hypothetical protein